jgi:hypothetical protein
VVLITGFILLNVTSGIFPQVQRTVFPDRTDLETETAWRDVSLVQSFRSDSTDIFVGQPMERVVIHEFGEAAIPPLSSIFFAAKLSG